MMHDVLSQYFPSIKNGANTFYINKVSKTYYSVEGFNSLKFELGNSKYLPGILLVEGVMSCDLSLGILLSSSGRLI